MWKWNADVAYDLDITYDPAIKIFVGTEDVTATFPPSKLVYNAAAGTILYKKNTPSSSRNQNSNATAW